MKNYDFNSDLFIFMSKEEYYTLVEELNNLSTNEEKNKQRMIEIAHILTTELLHKWNVLNAEKSYEKNLRDYDVQNVES